MSLLIPLLGQAQDDWGSSSRDRSRAASKEVGFGGWARGWLSKAAASLVSLSRPFVIVLRFCLKKFCCKEFVGNTAYGTYTAQSRYLISVS